MAVDEDVVRLLAERRGELGMPVVGPTAAQYAALCDKWALAGVAAAAGVDHPATVVIGAGGPSGSWPALPSIVKPRISHSNMAELPIVEVTTADERDAAIRRILDSGVEALVQEQIIGGRRWVGHCVRGPGGVELIASRIVHDYPRATGVASVQHTCPAPDPVREGLGRLLAAVDYRGPATISFLQTGDRFLVHDVNLRLGASVGLLMASGLDMPRRAVEIALGDEALHRTVLGPTGYVRTDGEICALGDALRGRRNGEGVATVAARIGRAAVRKDRMLDPSPLDMFWVGSQAATWALNATRSLLRGLSISRDG